MSGRMHRREHIAPNGLLTTVTNCSFPTASVDQTDCHSYAHYPVTAIERRRQEGYVSAVLGSVVSSRGAQTRSDRVRHV